ncbi:MAG TPA: hypothetical protein VGN52_17695 [Burkholderiales bacterium]
MKKSIKLVTAATLLFAAAGAYAGSDDGTSDDAWLQHRQISQAAPAPTASASSDTQTAPDSSEVSPLP